MRGTSQISDDYVYQVHPSYKSQTAIRITRSHPPPNLQPAGRQQQQNPYIYKPKSYSKKRIFSETSTPAYTPPSSVKKIKINMPSIGNPFSQNYLDQSYLFQQLKDVNNCYFAENFRKDSKMEEQNEFKLPLSIENTQIVRKNPQLSHKIQIVSTQNNKLLISIHEGVLRANTNHSKQEQSLEGIANPFNADLKKYFSEKINFIRDYKSGYTPIDLQTKSNKNQERQDHGGYDEKPKKEKESASKAHFIKKKQSTLSLTRTCGVSYIRPTESIQGPPYEPLPPIIFQCSTSCQYTSQLRQVYGAHISELINLSQSRWLPVIMTQEEHMRDLLLGKPFGKVIWVNGLLNLWPFFNQGTFLLVLMNSEWAGTQEQVWKQFGTCQFKFGILAKKSTSGKKLFLKSIQPEGCDKDQTVSLQSLDTLGERQMSIKSQMLHTDPKEDTFVIRHNSELDLMDAKIQEEKKMDDSPPEERKQCKDVCQQFMRELKNTKTVVTMSIKFEMYVDQFFWKKLPHQDKNLLNAIIHSFEEHLQQKSIEVIRDRLELARGIHRDDILASAFLKIRLGQNIDNFPSMLLRQSQFSGFNLQSLLLLNSGLQNRNPIIDGLEPIFSDITQDRQGKKNQQLWQKSLKMPIYYITTRDSFAFDLVEDITYLKRDNRTYKKIVYRFQTDNLPENFGDYKKLFPDLKVGVTSYHDFFSEEQLQYFEARTLQTEKSAFKSKFLQMTVQPTIVGYRIKRTKFFFGYRYMWTRCQLAEPMSYVGAGVRRDVTPAPKWLKQIQNPMVEHGIIEPNFLNSVAINVYHDGTEGLAQHFDDAVRFKQPIYTLRLVSDGRLSFGSQFYGFCNGAFIVPLPRGCICMMSQNSYAANGVKHCVRPCDMSGKSAAIILRQMHHQVVSESTKYDELIDFPAWLSTLSEDSKAITYAEQKRRQAQQILADEDNKKQKSKIITAPTTIVPQL